MINLDKWIVSGDRMYTRKPNSAGRYLCMSIKRFDKYREFVKYTDLPEDVQKQVRKPKAMK